MSSGAQLRALRERAGVTQNQLAKLINKSHTYVWSVEAGRERLTSRETIQAWAEALHVAPDELYQAIGMVPHDIVDLLAGTDATIWDAVRELLQLDES